MFQFELVEKGVSFRPVELPLGYNKWLCNFYLIELSGCSSNPCGINADCTDTDGGSFTCTCNDGFTGDGFSCSGKSFHFYLLIICTTLN